MPKVAFQYPGGEERDEAAGLRVCDGDGAAVRRLPRSARSPRCARPGRMRSSRITRPPRRPAELIRAWLRPGSRCSRNCRVPRTARCCCAPICMMTTSSPPSGIVAGHRPQTQCRRPRLRSAATHAQLRGPAGRRPSQPDQPDGGPSRNRRPPGRQWLFARSVQQSIGSPLMYQVATRLHPHSPRPTRFIKQAFDRAPKARIWTAMFPTGIEQATAQSGGSARGYQRASRTVRNPGRGPPRRRRGRVSIHRQRSRELPLPPGVVLPFGMGHAYLF